LWNGKIDLITGRASDILHADGAWQYDYLNKKKKLHVPRETKTSATWTVVLWRQLYRGYKSCWKNDDPITTDVRKRIKIKTPYSAYNGRRGGTKIQKNMCHLVNIFLPHGLRRGGGVPFVHCVGWKKREQVFRVVVGCRRGAVIAAAAIERKEKWRKKINKESLVLSPSHTLAPSTQHRRGTHTHTHTNGRPRHRTVGTGPFPFFFLRRPSAAATTVPSIPPVISKPPRAPPPRTRSCRPIFTHSTGCGGSFPKTRRASASTQYTPYEMRFLCRLSHFLYDTHTGVCL